MVAITVRNLRKAYGPVLAVDDVTLDVEDGEIFGIIGPNGSGKTTTVEYMQGLRPPDGGHIHVLGLDPQLQRQDLRRKIGSQLQESALPDRLKVWEALDLFAAMVPESVDCDQLIDEWGLAETRNRAFAHPSGGQRQRLLVALALVNNPEVVFIDEMTTGLDPAARRVAWGLIEAVRERRTTVVLVTHFMDEAERLTDRVAVFDQGRVVALDTPGALIDAYTDEAVVTFTTDAPDVSWLDGIAEVRNVERSGDRVEVHGTGALLALTATCPARGASVAASHALFPPGTEAR